MTFTLLNADAIEAMQAMAENSVDAIVTDPPYGLEFMGKEWDRLGPVDRQNAEGGGDRRAVVDPEAWMYGGEPNPYSRSRVRWQHGEAGPAAMQEWHHAWATEALRILKPGGHLLAFGGTRTYHRLACAIEDAGFEIRDCLAWMYGSGFPKSLDVSKAIDKAAGAEREVVGTYERPDGTPREYDGWQPKHGSVALGDYETDRRTFAPATPEAQHWNGWGTALKPAFEPIVLARKPLSERNVAANVQRWGTGALNIDGCRIDGVLPSDRGLNGGGYRGHRSEPNGTSYQMKGNLGEFTQPAGRWPANVTLDETAAAMLDEQTGERLGFSGGGTRGAGFRSEYVNGERPDSDLAASYYGDTGGASRFFYCPKADREERNRGLGHLAQRSVGIKNDSGRGFSETDPYRDIRAANHHPTVKPVELMRWLCRMVTPKGGTVLDPFTGSGSTGVAAMREGFEFIGIEREAEYVEIARSRIYGDSPLFNVEVGGGPTE